MERGYIKVWRKTLDSGLLQNDTASRLFFYLLLNASHRERKFTSNGSIVELKAGEVIIGRKTAACCLNLSEQKIRTALEFLKRLQIITIKTTNRFTVVSLVNWDFYQGEQPTDNQQNNHDLTTTQELNNINNNSSNYYLSSGDDTQQLSLLGGTEEQKPKVSRKTRVIPDCPHGEIVRLYHEILTMMPRVKVWDSDRQGRLRWCWKNRFDDGKYKTVEEGIAFWKRLFEHIRDRCPWLTGEIEGRGGRPFECNLAWIVKRANFIKIIEGNYDKREAA